MGIDHLAAEAYGLDSYNKGGLEDDDDFLAEIHSQVIDARRWYGVDKVNIIGHSRGGLVSRLGLEVGKDGMGLLSGKINSLVTLSSPHHG